jgi:L-threonylcarbamoyladenylate synthase
VRGPRVLPFPRRGLGRAALGEAAAALRAGRLLAFPTDTVYGLGAGAFRRGALRRLKRLKGRARGKPFAVLVESVPAAERLARLNARARALARAFWPGALTLVLVPRGRGRRLPRGPGGVALRVPAHPGLKRLIRASGQPLAATSANRSGHPECRTAAEAASEFGPALALVLDGGRVHGKASTVVDLTGPGPVLVREGALAWRRVRRALARGRGAAGRRAGAR